MVKPCSDPACIQTRLCELQAYKRADEFAAKTRDAQEEARVARRLGVSLAERIAACLAACASPEHVAEDGTGEDIGDWLICDICEDCWRPDAPQKHYEGCPFLLLLDQPADPRPTEAD